MAIPNTTDRGAPDPSFPVGEDRKAQRAVLTTLIGEHPTRFTIPEISRAMNEGGAGFEREDAVERAIRELVAVGLLDCEGGFAVPTRAALHFETLEFD
jgi:hypothetical protein